MPTYEYVCSSCANAWEEVQKISEPALEVCPKCHAHTAKRQISGGNFILKGGGWYADLYSSQKPSAAKSDDGGSSGGDAKPAAAKDGAAPAAASPSPSTAPAAPTGSKDS
jgi:putative FmdB family regulatory protein